MTKPIPPDPSTIRSTIVPESAKWIRATLPADGGRTLHRSARADLTWMFEGSDVGPELEHLPTVNIETKTLKPLPDQFVHLSVGELIGMGGMGQVNEALQHSLNRAVAIKRIRKERLGKASREAMAREAQLIGRLSHPNILPILGFGKDQTGELAILMPKINGEPWSDILDREPRDETGMLTPEGLHRHLKILLRITSALGYAHDQNIIHRDIKPENVLVGAFGEVYLIDWGVAVELDDHGNYVNRQFAGTPAYAAPEMLTADSLLSARTDIYLLGSNLHEIATGRRPNLADSLEELIEQSFVEVDPETLPPGRLGEICRKALRVDSGERYASCEEFSHEVEMFTRAISLEDDLQNARQQLDQLERMLREGHEDPMAYSRLGTNCRLMIERARSSFPHLPEPHELLHRYLLLNTRMALRYRYGALAKILLEQLTSLYGRTEETDMFQAELNRLIAQFKTRSEDTTIRIQHQLMDQIMKLEDENKALRNLRPSKDQTL